MKRWTCLWGVFLFCAATGARAGSFLEIRPSVVEISGVPGETTKGYFSLRNTRDDPLSIKIEVEDGWVQQIGRPSSVPPSEWLFLKIPKKLKLRAGEIERIPYRIRIPAGLKGEVMALVFFSGPPEKGPKSAMGLQLRHGIPIYLSAKGTEHVALTISEAKAYVPPAGGLEIGVTLASGGNTHVRPRGEWVVTDFFGGETERIPLEFGAPVFPGARKQYFAQAKRVEWAAGQYKAHLSVTYGENVGLPKTLDGWYTLDVKEGHMSLVEEVPHGH
jgi:hypothetical protein